jgi:hypothetical protein
MTDTIAQVVYNAGQQLAESKGDLANELNNTLNQLLDWSFKAGTGFAKNSEGQKTEIFGTLIFTAPQSCPSSAGEAINADNLACVIDVAEDLNIEQLRTSYQKIASAKSLKKSIPPDIPGTPYTTITLGIVFARNATVPIEALAEELALLNHKHPDREWTDMVVLLSKAVINYAVQLPGKGVMGDFLPPAEGATERYSAAMYVIIMIRPTKLYTFNKMFAYLLAHLMIFSPGAKIPDWSRILEGVSPLGIVITGYQYDLNGHLVPVPRQFYNDRYLPPLPHRIEDTKGNLLSTLQFIPWQNGGVVLLRGKLPLEGLLVFLGEKGIGHGGIVRLDDYQISNVLPIGHSDFGELLSRIQTQTNMVVKRDPSKFVLQKYHDEGSSSPFMARLYMGILRLRDIVFRDDTRKIFDEPYNYVMENLVNTRSTSQEIISLVSNHFDALAKGEVGKLQGQTIRIQKTIDKQLRKEVESFLNSAVRAFKQGMQNLVKALGVDIGFLFQNEGAFNKGIARLEGTDPSLAAYLKETRKWSQRLINARNDIEHGSWMLPKVRYHEVNRIIHAEEPEISGEGVSDFVNFILDRLCCFVEEVTAHCLQAKMPEEFSLTEIAFSERNPEIPERFMVTLAYGGMPIWNIAYHQSTFENT